MIKFDRYPEGKRFAVTFSYDDGNTADLRLIEIFNKYNLKATFNLVSGRLGHNTVVSEDDVKKYYVGHEVACHGQNHLHLERMPADIQLSEILEDRRALERVTGRLVRGMAYPYGTSDDDTVRAAKSCGIAYARDIRSTGGYSTPSDFMMWHPTCHHLDAVPIAEKFVESATDKNQSWMDGGLLYIWGHSYEFDRNDNWDLIEKICSLVSGLGEVWYATNIEICDYLTAQRGLIFSADKRGVFNPSSTDVWISSDGAPVKIGAGCMVTL